jgi:ubiquinone/menaquinone biosynthesis C-methylase UbiE
MTRFAASLYDSLMRGSPMQRQFKEVARDLTDVISQGRLLDVGTGPGRLLLEIHALNPSIELYGQDVSAAMIEQARRNLSGIPADLSQGNIRQTHFQNDHFDLVTCTGSFYLWERPEEGLEEIHRILKAGQSAYLYESHREYDREEFREALQQNLRHLDAIRRIIGPLALKRQLSMSYTKEEIAEIVERTSFANSFAIRDMTLSSLPIFVRIELRKAPPRPHRGSGCPRRRTGNELYATMFSGAS